MESKTPLKVFFDGACILCSKEIEHYGALVSSAEIDFIDFASEEFDASSHGLEVRELRKTLHSCTDSRIFKGVDTFMEIWSRIPRYKRLCALVGNPYLKPVFRLLYYLFTLIRPFLPKKRGGECGSNRCSRGGL